MRVGIVSAEYPPAIGGVGDHTAYLARELAATGMTVEILTGRTPASSAEPLTVLREISRWDWRILVRVPAIARARRWDVLHIQYQPAAYALHGAINVLPWSLRVRGVRPGRPAIVTTFHDLRFPYLFPNAGPLRKEAVRTLAAGSDAVIAVADDDIPTLQCWRSGKPSVTTQHVHLGNQLGGDPPATFERGTWRLAAGISPDAPLVGYLGLINRSKGVTDLVKAVAQLPGVHLVLIGEQLGTADFTNAAYRAEVQALVHANGLAARTHWTGYLAPESIRAWLGAVECVALPFSDGASLRRTSLIASWAEGVPVVTTAPHTPAPWFDESAGRHAAHYVIPGDINGLRDALSALLSSPQLRQALARGGMAMAARFSWPDVVARTRDVYRAALNAAGGERY